MADAWQRSIGGESMYLKVYSASFLSAEYSLISQKKVLNVMSYHQKNTPKRESMFKHERKDVKLDMYVWLNVTRDDRPCESAHVTSL